MTVTAILYGTILIVLGIGGYFGSGRVSITALIPCLFGLPVLGLALWAWVQPSRLKLALHACLIIALLGFMGTVSAWGALVTLLSGAEVARVPAVIAKSVMALLSLTFMVLGIASFVRVRVKRHREAIA